MIKVDRTLILNKIMEYKGFQTKAAFAEFLGISTQNLSAWYKRNTFDENKIVNAIPELKTSWLLTGEGEMLKDESISQNAYGDNNQIAGRDINNNGVRGNTTTTNNTTNNYKDCGACETSLLEKAIDEMGEQRKLFAEQINRLLTIIEKMNDR